MRSATRYTRGDVWAVGAAIANSTTSQTLALHFDGTNWQVIPSDNPPTAHGVLESVAGTSPSQPLWATGAGPLSKPLPADGTRRSVAGSAEGVPLNGHTNARRKFQVAARLTAGLYPALADARRSSFQAAIAATRRTGYLTPPAVRWDMLDEATVTMECEARDPATAAETVRAIIRRNAEFVAQIGVRDIEVVKISPAS